MHRAYHLQEEFGSTFPSDSMLLDLGEQDHAGCCRPEVPGTEVGDQAKEPELGSPVPQTNHSSLDLIEQMRYPLKMVDRQ